MASHSTVLIQKRLGSVKCQGCFCKKGVVRVRKHIPRKTIAAVSYDLKLDTEVSTKVTEGYWKWNDKYNIRYQQCGDQGPVVLLIHGFGANCDHWRKNIGELGQSSKCFAIDLLGFGYSDKPSPSTSAPNTIYNFENWGQQIIDFAQHVNSSSGPVFLICNSVGGIAGLQAATMAPDLITGVQIINISLRKLHVQNQPALLRPLIWTFQYLLRETSLGLSFFDSVAKKRTVDKILKQAYHDPSAVTEELVDLILTPGLQKGAPQVFLDFVSYSSGPLPGELLQKVKVPVSIIWGAEDPWEKVEWGREFATYDIVEEYLELPNVGHCPQDERPDLVNPLVLKFIARHSQC
eukprot:TRINITY_DN10305_c0_g1_i1.p1 TRINITY_DN10305_c0_g1~~TRINITY_DN10305_c0_g1_i1.p1  ORF type:complete len:380 (-),score=11.60 TRINITY_DN10305_c0_g1_i1:328-1374(-)